MKTFLQPLLVLMAMMLQMPAFSQNASDFMAPVWLGTHLHPWKNPFLVHSEPLGRTGSIGLPLKDPQGGIWLPIFEEENEISRLTGTCQPVMPGLGGYLEQKAANRSTWMSMAWGWMDKPDLICMKSGKKGVAQIGMIDDKGKFAALPWSKGEWDDLNPVWHPDGRLIFQSSRAGGKGGMDLWQTRFENGIWAEPALLDFPFNTQQNEILPTIDRSGKFYFASNGQDTKMGGYDIYSWDGTHLEMLPYPFNSVHDDIGTRQAGQDGAFWVASNRPTEGFRKPGPMQLFRITSKPALTVRTVNGRNAKVIPDQPFFAYGSVDFSEFRTDTAGMCKIYLRHGEWVDLKALRKDFDSVRVRAQTIGSPGIISMTERDYFQLTLQVNENGVPARRQAMVWIYQNGIPWDSAHTNEKGILVRDLLPGTAYKVKAELIGYPLQEITFATGRSGKNNYSRSIQFGSRNVEYVRWQVRNNENKGLAGVKVQVFENREPVPNLSIPPSDSGGWGGTPLPEGKTYMLYASSGEQMAFMKWNTTAKEGAIDTSNVIMNLKPVSSGSLLAKFSCPIDPFALQVGNFDEMHVALMTLEAFPDMKIELGVHTDSRGSAATNLRRSQQAADFALDFFKGKGIASNRLVAKGYGEAQIQNRCTEGVNCNDEEHQVNNRLEIRVL